MVISHTTLVRPSCVRFPSMAFRLSDRCLVWSAFEALVLYRRFQSSHFIRHFLQPCCNLPYELAPVDVAHYKRLYHF